MTGRTAPGEGTLAHPLVRDWLDGRDTLAGRLHVDVDGLERLDPIRRAGRVADVAAAVPPRGALLLVAHVDAAGLTAADLAPLHTAGLRLASWEEFDDDTSGRRRMRACFTRPVHATS